MRTAARRSPLATVFAMRRVILAVVSIVIAVITGITVVILIAAMTRSVVLYRDRGAGASS